jgi:hypothetical protein
MRRVAALLLAASLFGCTTTAPGVRVTRDAGDVEHCKHIGAVQTIPPYSLPGEDLEQLRSRSAAVGGDTVLLNTSRGPTMTGIAFRCRTS